MFLKILLLIKYFYPPFYTEPSLSLLTNVKADK